jgi:hypothetical protein
MFVWNPFFLLAGGLLFDEKSAKVLHYFGLDCGTLEFLLIFFSQATLQRTIVDFPHFWRPLVNTIPVPINED